MWQYFYKNLFTVTVKKINERDLQCTSESMSFDKFSGVQQQFASMHTG